jgi:RNAse (barnase) inhibitor barstar
MVDSILRAEDLDNDWPKLMEQVKLDVTLPSVNVASKESYQQYYTEESMVDAVTRRYIHDVNIFDYTFM